MKAWKRAALICGLVFLKLSLLYWGALNFDFKAHPDETWLSTWSRWDSKAYRMIAEYGYRGAAGAAPDYHDFLSHFPPLYPLTIRTVYTVSGVSPIAAGFGISFLSILLVSFLLYKLVMLDFANERAAWLSVFFLNLFPTSYFTLAVYSESLFLLFTIGAFYFLRRTSHGGSAVFGFAAVLTRLAGVTLVPVYIYAWFKKRNLKNALLLASPVLGVLVYLWINKHYFGHALFFMGEYQHNAFTGKKLIVPFSETLSVFKQFLLQSFDGKWDFDFMMRTGWGSIFTLFALAVTIFGIGTGMPLEYSIYALASILFFASFSWGVSNARYVLSVFPIVVVLGRLKSRSAVGMLLISFLILLMYFTRFYVRGWWAF